MFQEELTEKCLSPQGLNSEVPEYLLSSIQLSVQAFTSLNEMQEERNQTPPVDGGLAQAFRDPINGGRL